MSLLLLSLVVVAVLVVLVDFHVFVLRFMLIYAVVDTALVAIVIVYVDVHLLIT